MSEEVINEVVNVTDLTDIANLLQDIHTLLALIFCLLAFWGGATAVWLIVKVVKNNLFFHI